MKKLYTIFSLLLLCLVAAPAALRAQEVASVITCTTQKAVGEKIKVTFEVNPPEVDEEETPTDNENQAEAARFTSFAAEEKIQAKDAVQITGGTVNWSEDGNTATITLTSQSLTFTGNIFGLDIDNAGLTALDLTQNSYLLSLHCTDNALTTLNVSKNLFLGALNCSNNALTTLDVSHNEALVGLYCINNKLTSITLPKAPEMNTFNCQDNQLTSLDLKGFPKLEDFNCDNNQLTKLDLTANAGIFQLNCHNNRIKELLLPAKFEQINGINCWGNGWDAATSQALINALQEGDASIVAPEVIIFCEAAQRNNVIEHKAIADAKAKQWAVVSVPTGEDPLEEKTPYAGLPDAIKSLNATAGNAAVYYDLTGRRVAQPTAAGVYIQGGKKVYVK